MSDFYKNTIRDREAFSRFKRLCYIPIYGLIGFYYPIFMHDFCLIKPMSIDDADKWSKFGRKLHFIQGIYITTIVIYIIKTII